MNKSEITEILSSKLGLSKKQVEELVDSLLDIITSTIKAGNEVTFTGFGTFSAKTRSARLGVNPRNPKEKIQIPAVRVPKFKSGKALKDALKSI